MKTKAVYVVTSSDKDYFLEQLILSVHSLKLWNPSMSITLVTDNETAKTFTEKRKQIFEYITDLITEEIPSDFNKMQRSRYLKTSLRRIVKGDFLYIDTDTIITGDLSEVDSFQFDLGAVLDRHMIISNHTGKKNILKYAKMLDWAIPEDNKYFNGGIMYAKDSKMSHNFYSKWHELWISGIKQFDMSIDQPSLAKANAILGYPIIEMDGTYNCQIIENGLSFLHEAKIIHYFASNIGKWDCPYIFRDNSIYEIIKTKGITAEIDQLVRRAKSAFNPKTLILAGNMCDSYFTTINGLARRIFIKFPWISNMLDKIYMKLSK